MLNEETMRKIVDNINSTEDTKIKCMKIAAVSTGIMGEINNLLDMFKPVSEREEMLITVIRQMSQIIADQNQMICLIGGKNELHKKQQSLL